MKDILGISELKNPVFWRDVLTEIICSTMLLTFLTCNMVEYFPEFQVTPTHAGLVMGLVVCAIIETFGHISGAHMNPAVTFMMTCRRDISPVKGVIYTIGQCVGGAAGSGLVYGFSAPEYRGMFSAFQPAEALGPIRGMFIEVVLTFTLCVVIQGVTDPRRPTKCNIPGIPIGFTVAVNIMAGMTYTGAAFNPIIALGPAIITRNFQHHWIYWAGAYIGALIAVVIYNLLVTVGTIFGPKPTKHDVTTDNVDEMLQLLQDLRASREQESHNNNMDRKDTKSGAI